LRQGDLHQLQDLAAVPHPIARFRRCVRKRLRRVGVQLAILHAGHLLPERTPHLDDHVALGGRDGLLDLDDESFGLAGDGIDAQEVFRLDRARTAIAEPLKPFPCSWPAVALLPKLHSYY